MKDFKYIVSFSSTIRPLVSEEKDVHLALAALQNIGDFIPNIDTDKNIDLLPIAFNAFVANRVNKNGDVIDTASSLAIVENFINKPINIEHSRDKVIGTILTAGFSEFGTDRPLSLEEVKDSSGPFNVTLGGVIWRSVNADLADLIEESSDPTSEEYLSISASWELGFSEYNIAMIEGPSKNIENAEIIVDSSKILQLSDNLKAFGGDGVSEDGKSVYRLVVGEIFPLGIGLTESPAADVKGVVTNSQENLASTHESSDLENTISQVNETNVINKYKSEDKIMKINSIKDITDESLKEMSASSISDFIESEIRDASEKFVAEKTKVDDALKETEEKHTELSKEHDKVKSQIELVQNELDTLNTEKLEREALESFNNNMSAMDEKYELTDEDRTVIASDIKDMNEEGFESYLKKMEVLLSQKNRESIAKANAEAEAKAEEEVKEAASKSDSKDEAKAEKTAEEVVDEVLEDSQIKAEVPVSSTANDPTVYDKYRAAFSIDGFDIN